MMSNSNKGRPCTSLWLGILAVFLYSAAGGTAWADDSTAQLQEEIKAFKAELESLKAERRADKDKIKAHDDELLASKQEFSQVSNEVRNWKANPEAVETLRDQIKKELGIVPNVYNELANRVRLGFELRTRAEFENNWHRANVYSFDPLFEDEIRHPVSGDFFEVGRSIGPTQSGGGADQRQFFVLNRVRFNIDADVHEHLRTFVQIQDSRFWGVENGVVGFRGDNFGGANLLNVAHLDDNNREDLHQAYVDIRKLFNPNLTFRVGRQEIVWGTPTPGDPGQRMIGSFDWSNIGITFDAIRGMWDTERYGVEGFAAIIRHSSLLNASTRDDFPSGGVRERDQHDRKLYGTKITLKKLVPNSTVELMYLLDDDQMETPTERPGTDETVGPQSVGRLFVNDVGVRVAGKILKPIDYAIEGHFQAGDFRGQKHQAQAASLNLGYTFDKVMWRPRIGYEFDWSPGNDDPASKQHTTFVNFYPDNHQQYGYIDLMSWKNVIAHNGQIKVYPTSKLSMWVNYWHFDVENSNDGWYNAEQVMLLRKRPTNPADIGNFLGQEVDFAAKYDLFKNVGVMAGYSRFFAGTFIDKLTGSSSLRDTSEPGLFSNQDTDWGFLQLLVSF